MEAVERRFRVMASEAHVVVVGGGQGAEMACSYAQSRLDQLEQRWNRFLPHSDVSRVNLASGTAVAVHPDTLTLFTAMQRGWTMTGGRFDPTVLPALVVAGYRASIEDAARTTNLPPWSKPGSRGHAVGIVVDVSDGTVLVPFGTAVDPGGIGKGLAADIVATELVEAGCEGALVSVGGDIAMAGVATSDDGWLIAVEQPDPVLGDLCTIAVDGGTCAGVATSSTRSRSWRQGAKTQHHLIDPRTGEPSDTDLVTVTVVATRGWQAEVHATAAILNTSVGVHQYLEHHGLSGIAVTEDGAILHTPDLDSVPPFCVGALR